jgi:DNA-binding CsgD family transcriptional regulator
VAGQQPLLRELAGRAGPGSDGWCAAQYWLAWTTFEAADMPGALQCCDAVTGAARHREPPRVLPSCLALQAGILANMGRLPEAAAAGRRGLAVARALSYPTGQAHAAMGLGIAVAYAGDLDEAARLARQGEQIPGTSRGVARMCGYLLAGVLADTGDLPAAGQACAAMLTQARDAGDLNVLSGILPIMADLDLRAGRAADAAAHLRESARTALQTGHRLMMLTVLDGCGFLCAATGRPADAITAWAAVEALYRHGGVNIADTDPYAPRREEAVRQAREILGPDRARAAEQRGEAMSPATVSEYALMLTAPAPPPSSAAPGATRLSARERELVTLVAQGRTDAQIAAQLYISIRTVRSHLDRIRDKTGCRRRADLTRLALSVGLV